MVRNLQLAEAVMWIMTKVGFFSVVQKAEDVEENALTIRARVRADLVALKREYLPEMGPIVAGRGTDYRFRARVRKDDWAGAMTKIGRDVDYENFKDEVKRVQGPNRARLYEEVWHVLNGLTLHPVFHHPTFEMMEAGTRRSREKRPIGSARRTLTLEFPKPMTVPRTPRR